MAKKSSKTSAEADKRKRVPKARASRAAVGRTGLEGGRADPAAPAAAPATASDRTDGDAPAGPADRRNRAAKPAAPKGHAAPAAASDKLSAVDAAAKVLAEADAPMTCGEMIAVMAAKGYWASPAGKTPSATLYSALLRECQTKGAQSRFTKTGRGKFDLTAQG
jgi:hypothetical protein